MTTLEKAHKLIEKGKQRADWFKPSAEVVLAGTAKEICEKALRAERKRIIEKVAIDTCGFMGEARVKAEIVILTARFND